MARASLREFNGGFVYKFLERTTNNVFWNWRRDTFLKKPNFKRTKWHISNEHGKPTSDKLWTTTSKLQNLSITFAKVSCRSKYMGVFPRDGQDTLSTLPQPGILYSQLNFNFVFLFLYFSEKNMGKEVRACLFFFLFVFLQLDKPIFSFPLWYCHGLFVGYCNFIKVEIWLKLIKIYYFRFFQFLLF